MAEFVFEATHNIYYSTEKAVPIKEMAHALLALEKIILSGEGVFEGVAAVDIDRIEVLVSKIESGSLSEDILVKFFFKDQAGLDAFISKLRGVTLENGKTGYVLLGLIISALVGIGALYAAQQTKTGNTSTITANNNVIINLGAGEVAMTPEAFRALIDTAVKDRRALAENAVQFVAPARSDKKSGITFDQNNDAKITPELIAEIPLRLKAEKPDYGKDYSDVDLQVRAMDLDSHQRGWAGVVPGLVDRRVRLKLAENVKPSDLERFQLRADITIMHKRQQRGSGSELVPDYILVRNVIKDQGQ